MWRTPRLILVFWLLKLGAIVCVVSFFVIIIIHDLACVLLLLVLLLVTDFCYVDSGGRVVRIFLVTFLFPPLLLLFPLSFLGQLRLFGVGSRSLWFLELVILQSMVLQKALGLDFMGHGMGQSISSRAIEVGFSYVQTRLYTHLGLGLYCFCY